MDDERLTKEVAVHSAVWASEDVKELASALVAAQKKMTHVAKDASNPFFKSTYSSLVSVIDVARGPLNDSGIAIVQGASGHGENVTVTTRFLHTSGQWIETSLTMVAKDAGPQPVGSAVTYGRRYTLQSLAALASEDDDGEGATSRQAPEKKAPKRQTGTKKQGKKEEDEIKAVVKASREFDVAWLSVMDEIGDDDADAVARLKRHFLLTTTEKSDAFVMISDSLNGRSPKELKLLTAMVTKGKDKVAGLCAGEWRKELKLPALGVEICTVCGEALTEAEKSGCAVSGIAPHCDKHSGDALKEKFTGGKKK